MTLILGLASLLFNILWTAQLADQSHVYDRFVAAIVVLLFARACHLVATGWVFDAASPEYYAFVRGNASIITSVIVLFGTSFFVCLSACLAVCLSVCFAVGLLGLVCFTSTDRLFALCVLAHALLQVRLTRNFLHL